MKILDSDHCIAIMRGVLGAQKRITPNETLAVTTISVGELIHGANKSADPAKNIARVNLLLSTVTILPFDESAARRFGKVKADLERVGIRLTDLDLQIASIALTRDVVLLTHNQKHFARIPALQIEDWL
jgi:tRNA(fMet)-specific endonuclease VapC